MSHRWAVVLLAASVALAGDPPPQARGQISAMPFSTAEVSSTLVDPPTLAPPVVYAPPTTTPSSTVSWPPYVAGVGGVLGGQFDAGPFGVGMLQGGDWGWDLLPAGLIYRSYLAGGRESRFAGQFVHIQHQGWFLDASLGGRVGLLRYGSSDPVRPEGWQLDFEGAAFPRLTLDDRRELVSADYRYGVPLTFRHGMLEAKLAFYHLSSHLSDGFLEEHPGVVGNNYSRDTVVWGLGVWPVEYLRLYAEAGWAFRTRGPAKPWEFQFGAELSPSGPTGRGGAPFLALNGHVRQDVDFAGGLTVQAGWQWRGQNGQSLRTGLDYFNGKSDQMQFLTQREQQIGFGIWYDY